MCACVRVLDPGVINGCELPLYVPGTEPGSSKSAVSALTTEPSLQPEDTFLIEIYFKLICENISLAT